MDVVQHVREKFTCRACESISQAPAPVPCPAPRLCRAEPLGHDLFEKYGQHQPLNRQADRYARDGVDRSLSTLADQVGGCAVLLRLIYDLIRAHVFAASRVHGDDTTVPVLAKSKTRTGRLWTYVRDDRPFGGRDPPAAVFFYSRDCTGDPPERHLDGYAEILQADAYAGFVRPYAGVRRSGPITEAACWSHGRRKFFVLADIAAKARQAARARSAGARSGQAHRCRLRFRARDQRPIRRRTSCSTLCPRRAAGPGPRSLDAGRTRQASRYSEVANAMDYMLKRWAAFTRFLDDGRICLTKNAAERALHGI
jgi:hypothetical protein